MTTVVGIAGEELVVRKHFGEQQVAAAPCAVVTAVRAAGGTPVVLPPGSIEGSPLDALVLIGGRPAYRTADARRLPRGPADGDRDGRPARRGPRRQPPHLATGHPLPADRARLAAAALVPDRRVGSLHHQAVATHDDRWRCTAIGPGGVVEALEWADRDAWPALGVQWHPELDGTGPAVFGWLVSTAARPRRQTSGVTCFSALYHPLTYRSTGTGTASPAKATAS